MLKESKNVTYGQMLQEAQKKMGFQEVGDTVNEISHKLKNIIEETVQLQAEQCVKKGFNLPKYYIHIFIVKDPLAYHGLGMPNVLRIRKPHCRVTRPSPYQEEDHYLWSVTNLNEIKFEWCIPEKSTLSYIINNPHEFDKNYVTMLRRYVDDKLENIQDYVVDGKVI